MRPFLGQLLCTWVAVAGVTSPVLANEIPWSVGESRQVGYGHCAKGPCMKRTCWAATKPHRHVGNKIVIDRIGPPECWDNSGVFHQSARH